MVAAFRENIIETYLELASTLREAKVGRTDAFQYATGPLSLALCNFGIDFRFSEDPERQAQEVAALRRIVRGCPSFRAFALPGDGPVMPAQVLLDAGFVQSGRMIMMGARQVNYEPIALEEATKKAERNELALFMVQNFFFRRETALRDRIINSTAMGPHSLYAYRVGRSLAGAMMLSTTAGAVGVYNLCVAPRYRRKRLGRMMLAAASEIASATNKPLTLQSDRSLSAWYEQLGFESFGNIETFSAKEEIL